MSKPSTENATKIPERKAALEKLGLYLESLIKDAEGEISHEIADYKTTDDDGNLLPPYEEVRPLEIELSQRKEDQSKERQEFLEAIRVFYDCEETPTMKEALDIILVVMIDAANKEEHDKDNSYLQGKSENIATNLLVKTLLCNPTLKSDSFLDKDHLSELVHPLALITNANLMNKVLSAVPEFIECAFEASPRDHSHKSGKTALGQGCTLFQRHLHHPLVNHNSDDILKLFLERIPNSDLLNKKGRVSRKGGIIEEESIMDSIANISKQRDSFQGGLKKDLLGIIKEHDMGFVRDYREARKLRIAAKTEALSDNIESLNLASTPSTQINLASAQAISSQSQQSSQKG